MTFDASNRKDIRRAEKDSRQVDRRRGEVITALMSTTAGRAYTWSELEAGHVFHSSYADLALRMAFLEGERNAGLRLIDTIMEWCPDEFILMWRENRAREYSRQQPRSEDGDGRAEESDSATDDSDDDPYA